MVEQGATITRFTSKERAQWARALPNLAADWATRTEARGLPGNKILSAWMTKLRENNVDLVRNWDR